jgi:8-oxo-dGTP diphosphatase
MPKERFMVIPAVYAIFEKDGQILLLRRFNTGYQDGNYSLPAGHLDGKETLKQALIREISEEIGVAVVEKDLNLAHALHRNAQDAERIDFFFFVKAWSGEPRIMDPNKCDEMRWVAPLELPDNMAPEVKHVINNIYKNQSIYSDMDFNK